MIIYKGETGNKKQPAGKKEWLPIPIGFLFHATINNFLKRWLMKAGADDHHIHFRLIKAYTCNVNFESS